MRWCSYSIHIEYSQFLNWLQQERVGFYTQLKNLFYIPTKATHKKKQKRKEKETLIEA